MTFAKSGQSKPILVLIMGVSGSGKSTLAQKFAQQCSFEFLDADDFHTVESIEMMKQGIPLDDKIRTSWIGRINQRLHQLAVEKKSSVLAFSGLKQSYRQMIWDIEFCKYSFLLEVEKQELQRRLEQRREHFFNPELLDSQLATLEMPTEEEQITILLPTNSIEFLVAKVGQSIELQGTN